MIQAILGGVAKVSKFLKANPWVGSAVKYGVERRDMNRAHRRQMADLQAAGINPILSAKLGGAQTPSMEGLGTVQNTSRQIDQTEKTTDAQIKKIEQEIDNLIAQENLTNQQANNVKEATSKIIEEAKSLKFENVYKELISNHQKNNPNMTIAKYYGIDAKTIASIISGAAIGKGISSREGNKNTYNYNNSEINWAPPYKGK